MHRVFSQPLRRRTPVHTVRLPGIELGPPPSRWDSFKRALPAVGVTVMWLGGFAFGGACGDAIRTAASLCVSELVNPKAQAEETTSYLIERAASQAPQSVGDER